VNYTSVAAAKALDHVVQGYLEALKQIRDGEWIAALLV